MDGLVTAAVWCVLFGLYLLFAGTVGATEIVAGLFAVTLATLFMHGVHAGPGRRLRRAPPARVLVRPLLALAPDAMRVGRVLLQAVWRRPDGPVGSIARQPFRQGGDDPDDAGRRGIVVIAASLAPNGYALHIPAGEDVLVMHRLAAVPPSADREWPV